MSESENVQLFSFSQLVLDLLAYACLLQPHFALINLWGQVAAGSMWVACQFGILQKEIKSYTAIQKT